VQIIPVDQFAANRPIAFIPQTLELPAADLINHHIGSAVLQPDSIAGSEINSAHVFTSLCNEVQSIHHGAKCGNRDDFLAEMGETPFRRRLTAF